MENIWSELSESIKSAFEEASTRRKKDMAMIKNIPAVLSFLKDMNGEQLLLLLDQARKIKKRQDPKFPPINGDFYDTRDLLSADEKAIIDRVRKFMVAEVEPIATEYWLKGHFPMQLIPKFRELGIVGLTYPKSLGGQERSNLLDNMIGEEIARVDVSTCTFFGVQNGLALNSIYICGSEEQKQKFIPPMIRLEKIGAFGLTEPDVGSAVAMGLTTTCRREGETWTIKWSEKVDRQCHIRRLHYYLGQRRRGPPS